MRPEDQDLIIKVCGIASRIGHACSNPDSLPSFVHWSDVGVLIDAARRLEQQGRTIEALSAGIGLPSEDK